VARITARASVSSPVPFENESAARPSDLQDFVGLDPGAERLGLGPEALHQLKGSHAGGEAWVVLDPVGEEDLPAGSPFSMTSVERRALPV